MPIPKLTKDEVQAPRTQSELAQWLDETIEEFGKTPEGREAWRLYRGGCVKQLVEELLPVRWYADAFHQDDAATRFELVIGSQSYDAIVRDAENSIVCFLQITLAFDGYQSRLRMEHMTQHRHAPMTGVRLERDGNGRIPETWAECEKKDDRIAAEFEQVLAAFTNKAENRYEQKTKLVIAFRTVGIVDEDYMRRLDAFIRARILPIEHTFEELVFISGVQGHHLSYAANAT